MKKVLFFAILLSTSFIMNAQIEAGKIFAGGEIGLSTFGGSTESSITAGGSTTTTTTDKPSDFSFKLLPQAGFMLNDNLGIGAGLGYDYYKSTWIESHGGGDREMYSKTGKLVFEPFARYYKNTGEKAFAFGEFALPLQFGSRNSNSWDNSKGALVEDDPTKISSFGIKLSLGFNYFLNDRCALEAKWAGLFWNTETEKQEGDGYSSKDKSNSFGLGLDPSAISLGLRFFF